MERAKKRRRYPLWLRIALGLLAIVAMLLASAVALRFWITSDGGRAFILSQIDGRKVGPFGTLRLSGLKGDPLQAATLADIALVDDEGVWLRAKDARIEWTPTGLFAGELEIQVDRDPHGRRGSQAPARQSAGREYAAAGHRPAARQGLGQRPPSRRAGDRHRGALQH